MKIIESTTQELAKPIDEKNLVFISEKGKEAVKANGKYYKFLPDGLITSAEESIKVLCKASSAFRMIEHDGYLVPAHSFGILTCGKNFHQEAISIFYPEPLWLQLASNLGKLQVRIGTELFSTVFTKLGSGSVSSSTENSPMLVIAGSLEDLDKVEEVKHYSPKTFIFQLLFDPNNGGSDWEFGTLCVNKKYGMLSSTDEYYKLPSFQFEIKEHTALPSVINSSYFEELKSQIQTWMSTEYVSMSVLTSILSAYQPNILYAKDRYDGSLLYYQEGFGLRWSSQVITDLATKSSVSYSVEKGVEEAKAYTDALPLKTINGESIKGEGNINLGNLLEKPTTEGKTGQVLGLAADGTTTWLNELQFITVSGSTNEVVNSHEELKALNLNKPIALTFHSSPVTSINEVGAKYYMLTHILIFGTARSLYFENGNWEDVVTFYTNAPDKTKYTSNPKTYPMHTSSFEESDEVQPIKANYEYDYTKKTGPLSLDLEMGSSGLTSRVVVRDNCKVTFTDEGKVEERIYYSQDPNTLQGDGSGYILYVIQSVRAGYLIQVEKYK